MLQNYGKNPGLWYWKPALKWDRQPESYLGDQGTGLLGISEAGDSRSTGPWTVHKGLNVRRRHEEHSLHPGHRVQSNSAHSP